MNPEMRKKIDKILKKIVDPINLLSLFDLNFIKKVSYSETEKKMLVYTSEEECRRSGHKCERCMCCGWGWTAVKIRKELTERVLEGLQEEFSDLHIEVV